MRLVSVTELSSVVDHLKQGGVAVYPTESSYGIGCMASNAAAVRRVFALKDRPLEKTLPLIVGSVEEAKRLVEWSPVVEELTQKHWPGPLTIVARATEMGKQLASGVVASDGTIAIRVSSHPIAQALAETVGPIVSTSANRAGTPACFDVWCMQSWIGNADDVLVIDAGPLPWDIPSTIVRITDTGYELLRKGQAIV